MKFAHQKGTDAVHCSAQGKGNMAKRSTAELTKYVRLLAEAGVMKKPRWLESVERFVHG